MAVTGMQRPDSAPATSAISRLSGLFAQVLALCRRVGLVKLGHVALDGTIKANASKHKAMSRMVRAEAGLEAVVESWLDRAAAADGGGRGPSRGDEMIWPRFASGRVCRRTRRSATSPKSRILKTKDVHTRAIMPRPRSQDRKIIVAHALTHSTSDHGQLEPLINAIEANLGRRPREISTDARNCSKENLTRNENPPRKPLPPISRCQPGRYPSPRSNRPPSVRSNNAG